MPEELITLKEIDDLIATLHFKEGSHADVLLKYIRSNLKTDEDILSLRSIKTDDIIKLIWPKQKESTEDYNKILKVKRKAISSIKSQINKHCRDLYWSEQNPSRIGITRFNIFKPLTESKAEKVQKMQARIMFLEKLIADVAPESSDGLLDTNPDLEQAVKQIRQSVDQRRQQGVVIDSGGELIFEESAKEQNTEHLLPEAKAVIAADNKIKNMLGQMEDLYSEKKLIERKLENGEMTQAEAMLRLQRITSKQSTISNHAENLLKSDLSGINSEDTEINENLRKIKEKLVAIAEDKNINTDMLQDIIEKGLDALEEIEKQKASAEEKEEVKEEFSILKVHAKTLLNEIKPLQKEIKLLATKEKTFSGLSGEEKQQLLSFEARIHALQKEGKTLIEKLKVLEKECDLTTKESIILIVSCLEKFLSVVPEKRKYAEIIEEVPSTQERSSSPDFLKTLKEEKEKELDELSEQYKEIKKKIIEEQEDIENAREELNLLAQEKSSLAEEKLILKQMDKPLSNKGEEIINNIREKTKDFTKRLEDINNKEQQIYTDIRNHTISEAEGATRLSVLEKEKEQLIEASTKFEEYLNKSQEDSAEDPAVLTLLDRIKAKLKNMQSSHKNIDLKVMENMLTQGLEALEDLEKKEKELAAAEKQETEEDIKKEFIELKTKAKEILKSFKQTYPETQALLEKEKEGQTLNEKESETLQTNKKTIHSLRKLGEQTLTKLDALEIKTTGPMLEAVVLIKTTLAKFINQDDIKKRLLAKADKSKQTEASLKSEEGLMQEMLKAKTKIDETSVKIKQTEAEIANLEKIYDDLKTELKRKQMVLTEAENKAGSLEKRKSELLGKINELSIDVAASERMIQMHENQKLMDAANRFRHKLSGILDDKNLDEAKLDELIEKGLDAIAEAAGPNNVEQEGSKEIFIKLKDKAKDLLKTFKEIQKSKKEGDESPELTEKDNAAKEEAKALADEINQFIDKTSGSLREAAVLILSSIKRYIDGIETVKIVHSHNEGGASSDEGGASGGGKGVATKERIVERGSGIRSYFKDTFSTEEEALSDFKKAEESTSESAEATEEDKEKFKTLKDDSKELIEKFRDINRTLTKMEVEKKEAGGTLSPAKEKELQFFYIRRNHLQEEGKQLIADFENFKRQGGVYFKEPIGLIISSLKKFITDIVEVMQAEASLNIVKEKINIPSGYKIETGEAEMEEKEIGRLKQDLTRIIIKLRENLPIPEKEPLEKSNSSASSFLEDLNLTLNHFEISANHVDSSLIEKGLFYLNESIRKLKENNLSEAASDIQQCISEFEKTSIDLTGFIQLKKKEIESEEETTVGKQIKNIIHLGGDDDQVNINGKFLIDRFPVTIGQFKKFVDDTGYKTKAEKDGYGWVYKKRGIVVSSNAKSRMLTLQGTPSLSKIAGACWYNPDGIPSNSIELISLSDWPAVHVTYFDALAYANWVNKRLPTKEEWLETTGLKEDYDVYPWGPEPDVKKCNNKKSNFISLSPAQTFPPNDYEVFDLIGNAWEWCNSDDTSSKFVCGGSWNMDIADLKHPVVNKMEAQNANNTIGFRCIKDV